MPKAPKAEAEDDSLLLDTSVAVDYGYLVFGKRRISRYDHIVKRHSRRFGFDWRMISAQIYAESRFDTTACSRVGALGLMQIMPSTARGLGVEPSLLLNPEQNVALGCYYNHWLYNLWNDKQGSDRFRFTFASYNAGRERVLGAQRECGKEHWSTVKTHLPSETRKYVYVIFKKYEVYKQHFF